MARINIEDDIESRQEFWRLFEVVKDRDKCLGMLVRFFRLAQKHFGKVGPITFDELEAQGLAPMVEAGWAVACGDGYQALGAEKQFAWYRDQVAASKLGGEANRKKWQAIKSRPDIPLSSQPAIQPASEPSRQDSSLTLTPSLTLTNKNKTKEEKPPKPASPLAPVGDQQPVAVGVPKPKKPDGKDVAKFIARYVEAYEERYGARPVLDAIARGEAMRLVEGSGVDKACDIVTAYLQLSDKVFLAKCHDLTSLRMNVNRVSVAVQTGTEDPGKDAGWNKTVEAFLAGSGDGKNLVR